MLLDEPAKWEGVAVEVLVTYVVGVIVLLLKPTNLCQQTR
jgi:hypothetical protein